LISKKLKSLISNLQSEDLQPDLVVRAPGRANIIGEHVDYCEGIVLPFAIGHSMYFVSVPSLSEVVEVTASDYGESWKNHDEEDKTSWKRYFSQMMNVLTGRSLRTKGCKIHITSDIPIGAGVSSSSALCCGFLFLLNKINQWNLDDLAIIYLASEAEHGSGLLGGRMDQYAIMKGKKNQAIMLDCLDHSFTHCRIDSEVFNFVLIDSGVKHELVNSEYNTRRAEVERALALVQQEFGEEISYRGVEECHLNFLATTYPVEYGRLRHVQSEIARVQAAISAIKKKEINKLGDLLYLSHDSLKNDYEVSCEEIDMIVDNLKEDPNVYGARMMGGGFGGSVICLVKENELVNQNTLSSSYKNTFGMELTFHTVGPSDGISIIEQQ